MHRGKRVWGAHAGRRWRGKRAAEKVRFMLDGRPLVNVHLHPAPAAHAQALVAGVGACDFGDRGAERVRRGHRWYHPVAAHLAEQGVDIACASTAPSHGHAADRGRPAAGQGTARTASIIANLNPHLHLPGGRGLQRQLRPGRRRAGGIPPVRAGAPANDRALYAVPRSASQADTGCVVRSGTSSFPGSTNALAARAPRLGAA